MYVYIYIYIYIYIYNAEINNKEYYFFRNSELHAACATILCRRVISMVIRGEPLFLSKCETVRRLLRRLCLFEGQEIRYPSYHRAYI